MSKSKKFIGSIVLCVLIILEVFCLVSCNNKPYGKFYSIREAYGQGYISREDMKNIAYWTNKRYYEDKEETPIDFTPTLEPKELSEDIVKKIRHDAAIKKRCKEKDVDISYYGTYNGFVVVKVVGDVNGMMFSQEVIDGVYFSYPNDIRTELWIEK